MGVSDSTSVFSQRRDTLMSAAAVAQASRPPRPRGSATPERAAVWCWDITQPLPLSTKVDPSSVIVPDLALMSYLVSLIVIVALGGAWPGR